MADFEQKVQRIDHLLDQIKNYTNQGMIVVARNRENANPTDNIVATYHNSKKHTVPLTKKYRVQEVLHGGQIYHQYKTNIKY
jgi:hypothetical protein